MSRGVNIVVLGVLALAGCSVDLVEQDPPRDFDGDGRSTFRDMHTARSDAGFTAQDTDTRDYGQQLSDHMEYQRGGSQYRDD
jgi:hypothetical protein